MSPTDRGKKMIYTQFIKMFNSILNENIVQARIVNMQTVDFNDWCMRMANGSTVTAADVAAVMQQVEDKLPEILSLNAKVICSPGGLIFRPKLTGSITQSQLKKKLEARLAADPTLDIDVNRALTTSDLSISDLDLTIEVSMPKFWADAFKKRTTLKRVKTSATGELEVSDDSSTENGGNSTPSGGGSNNNPSGGGNTGGNNGGSGGDDENGDAI